jgi:hypothetical protein
MGARIVVCTLDGGEWSASRFSLMSPIKEPPHPMCRSGPQNRFGRGGEQIDSYP